MRSSVIAVALCVHAAAAGAQCAAQAPAAGVARTQSPGAVQTPVAGAQRHAAELVKAAPARTPSEQEFAVHDGLPAIHEAAPARKSGDEHPRRAGPAMLLAAVALMSGIALRRYTARMQ